MTDLIVVPSDFQPSVVEVTKFVEATTPTGLPVANPNLNVLAQAVISQGRVLTQCGESVTCHQPPLSSIVTEYDTTLTSTNTAVVVESSVSSFLIRVRVLTSA